MSKLAEIEAAAESLTAGEKQELILFLATRMRAQAMQIPDARKFSREQMEGWIAEDEADMRRFEQGK